ncbi:MAG TPA: hypothetical protein VK139_07240 [Microbacteriaceae bacterium]|nr:hypothetical protein [Microbacteriaceae bacterium]
MIQSSTRRVLSGVFRKSAVAGASVALLLGVSSSAWAVAAIDVNYELVEFANTDLDSPGGDSDDVGLNSEIGDTFDWEGVFPGVDARVEILDYQNLDGDVDKVDEGQDVSDGEDDRPMWIEINLPGDADSLADDGPGSATFRVDFFASGSNFTTPVSLRKVAVIVKDIDAGQSIQFTDVSSYEVSSEPESVIVPTEDGLDVTFTDGLGEGSAEQDESNWVGVRFLETSSLTFTVGAVMGGDAEFGLLFLEPEWSVEPSLVTLESEQPDPAPTTVSLASAGASAEIAAWSALSVALIGAGLASLAAMSRRSRA